LIPGSDKIIISSPKDAYLLWAHHRPFQYVLEEKGVGEADYVRADAKNMWGYTSSTKCVFTACTRTNLPLPSLYISPYLYEHTEIAEYLTMIQLIVLCLPRVL
jgi:hypothetical protein